MDFTYNFPESETFLHTLQRYLESQGEQALSSLLEDATCSFISGSQFTRRRWNEYDATLIIKVPLGVIGRITDNSKRKLTEFANVLMPTEVGYWIDNIEIGPLLEQPTTATRRKISPIDDQLCFVIMSFSGKPNLQDFYEKAIKPTVENLGFRCERVDEQEFNGSIREHILDNIQKARFVVADLTEARPNCYYEVGIAHALGKNIIHLANNKNDIHFDVNDFNFIIYERIDELSRRLKKRIEETVINPSSGTSPNNLPFF